VSKKKKKRVLLALQKEDRVPEQKTGFPWYKTGQHAKREQGKKAPFTGKDEVQDEGKGVELTGVSVQGEVGGRTSPPPGRTILSEEAPWGKRKALRQLRLQGTIRGQ